MPNARLKAPPHATSISMHGVEYKVKDGYLELPEMLIPIAEAHGYGKQAEKATIDAIALRAVGINTAEDVAQMNRGELLVYCEDNRIEFPPGTKLDRLREMVWKHMKAKQDLVSRVQS